MSDHRKRHAELHKALDELVACYIGSTTPEDLRAYKGLRNTTIMELIEWSHKATQDANVCKEKL